MLLRHSITVPRVGKLSRELTLVADGCSHESSRIIHPYDDMAERVAVHRIGTDCDFRASRETDARNLVEPLVQHRDENDFLIIRFAARHDGHLVVLNVQTAIRSIMRNVGTRRQTAGWPDAIHREVGGVPFLGVNIERTLPAARRRVLGALIFGPEEVPGLNLSGSLGFILQGGADNLDGHGNLLMEACEKFR